MKSLRTSEAFTLIELLIVVAIIAILAAIAVPNFLEAQTRAKVARARSDARTVATGLEAYAVDNNKYPVPRFITPQGPPTQDSAAQFTPGGLHAESLGGSVGGLTSPVSYLTSSKLKDPFCTGVFDNEHDDIFYQNIDYWYSPGALIAEAGNPSYPATLGSIDPVGQPYYFRNIYGSYKMGSIGPDKDYSGGRNIYDPTNGSISRGDIYRTQIRPEGGGDNR